ncbi:MAG: arginine--tRNA ligase [Rhodobacteraceae bacterium]|nr:MAG: arginine--tRNA ligase [Paracoccaceae bacterium]
MNLFQQIKEELLKCIFVLSSNGKLSEKAKNVDFSVEIPKEKSFGEMSSNLALVLGKFEGQNPRLVAEILAEEIRKSDKIINVEIAGPGFLNFEINNSLWFEVIISCLNEGSKFGAINSGEGKKANVEYVSANPTGPLHVGHMRGAVIGDVLANILEFIGYEVTREYYINDGGAQIKSLAHSVYLRYLECHGEEVSFSEGLYPGDYLKAVGKKVKEEYGSSLLGSSHQEWLEPISQIAVQEMLKVIKDDLKALGIRMDNFFSEKSLYDKGIIEETLSFLESKNLVYKGVLPPPKGKPKENWEEREQLLFKSTDFGDDVDRALRKADGEWTYFAPDLSYHFDKLSRGYDIIIDIFGADHAGYVKRMKSAVTALSDGKILLEVKLCQLVKLFKNGIPYKMSKREGNFVLLSDVVDEVGSEIARFVMLMRKNDAPLDFDFDKALEQSKDNPVFYVQYAHARANSILLKAKEVGLGGDLNNITLEKFSDLSKKEEKNLFMMIAMWPRIIEMSAYNREPHRIAFYLYDLAACFHALQHMGKVNPEFRFINKENLDISQARLCLVRATQIVLSIGLLLLGIKPAKRM